MAKFIPLFIHLTLFLSLHSLASCSCNHLPLDPLPCALCAVCFVFRFQFGGKLQLQCFAHTMCVCVCACVCVTRTTSVSIHSVDHSESLTTYYTMCTDCVRLYALLITLLSALVYFYLYRWSMHKFQSVFLCNSANFRSAKLSQFASCTLDTNNGSYIQQQQQRLTMTMTKMDFAR